MDVLDISRDSVPSLLPAQTLATDSELRRSGGVRCLLPRTVSRGQAARSVTINTGSLDQRYLSNIIITIQIYIMPEVTNVDCFAAPRAKLAMSRALVGSTQETQISFSPFIYCLLYFIYLHIYLFIVRC